MSLLRRGRLVTGPEFLWKLAVLSGGEVVTKVLSLFVFTMLARTLSKEGYATVEYLFGLSALFATIVESGLGAVGVRRIAHDADALPRLAAQVPAGRLLLAVISVPVMVLVAVPARLGPGAHGLVWLFALSLLPAAWRQDWLLQATGRMTEAASAQALRTIVLVGIVVILVRDSRDLAIVGWAEIAAVTAMSLYTLAVQQARITPCRLRPPMDGFMTLAREGVLLGLANVVWVTNQSAPLLLVAVLAGPGETASFAAAKRIVGSLLTFSYVYFFALYPAMTRAAQGDRTGLAVLLAASFRVTAWSATLVALTLSLVALPLSVLVFGAPFAPAAPVLTALAWVLPVSVLSGHARWTLIARGAQSRVVHAQLAGTLAVGITGIPLVLGLGGSGAALTSVVVAAAVWAAAHALATRSGAPLPPVRQVLVPGALAVAVMLGVRLLGLHGWAAGLGAVLFAALAPAVDRRLLSDVARLAAVPGNAGPLSPRAR